MKIVMVVGQFRPVIGGAEIFTERLAKVFAKSHEVTVVTGKQNRHSKKEAPLLEIYQNLTIERLNPWAFGKLKVYLLMVEMFFRVKKLLKTYDVVYAHQALQYAFVATLAGRIMHKKVVVVVASRGEGFDLRKLSKQFWWGKFAAHYMAKHAVLVASCQSMLEQDFNTWCDPIHNFVLISHAVLMQKVTLDKQVFRQQNQLPADDFIFICVSRLTPLKNHSTIIDAFAKIVDAYPNIRLIFLGEGEIRSVLENQAKSLAINGQVELRGNVRNVHEFLKASDVFILASDFEGESIASLEAMSVALPVVLSTGANSGIVTHNQNGLVFPTKDVLALAEQMKFLIENPSDAKRIGSAGKGHIQTHHDLEKIAERYLELFQSPL